MHCAQISVRCKRIMSHQLRHRTQRKMCSETYTMDRKKALCMHIMQRSRKRCAQCMKYLKHKRIQKALYYYIRNETAGRGAATATMSRPPPLP